MSNLIYGIFYADGYVDGGRDTVYWLLLLQRTNKLSDIEYEG